MTTSSMLVFLLVACVSFSFFPSGDSHAILFYPTARTGQAVSPGIKVTPLPVPSNVACGGTAAADPGPGAIVASFTAGQNIPVSWNVTIPHASTPGVSVAVQYSSTDTFSNNQLASGVDVATGQVSVALPAGKTSSAAVLQWIWASAADGGYYIGCSDIAILAAGSGGNSTTAPSGTTTTAAPGGTTVPKSEAFAIRYSVGVLAILLASVIAAFLYQ